MGAGNIVFISALLLVGASAGPLKASTIEIEDEVDEPTPVAAPSTKSVSPKGGATSENLKAGLAGKPMARVRISDKIGFYYFVKSGFVVAEESKVSALGKVTGQYEDTAHYSTPQKAYFEFSAPNQVVKKGDRLVIFRTVETASLPHTNSSAYWAQNLAIVKVLEVESTRCLVEATKSFASFAVGDKVKAYDDEMKRWKQAQVKKELSAHPIECFVIGGDPQQTHFVQGDSIVLAAGSQKGVVEGQEFELKEGKESGPFEPGLHLPLGKVRVFYAGPDFSMAQIVFSNRSIETGFEVRYQP